MSVQISSPYPSLVSPAQLKITHFDTVNAWGGHRAFFLDGEEIWWRLVCRINPDLITRIHDRVNVRLVLISPFTNAAVWVSDIEDWPLISPDHIVHLPLDRRYGWEVPTPPGMDRISFLKDPEMSGRVLGVRAIVWAMYSAAAFAVSDVRWFRQGAFLRRPQPRRPPVWA